MNYAWMPPIGWLPVEIWVGNHAIIQKSKMDKSVVFFGFTPFTISIARSGTSDVAEETEGQFGW